MAGVFLLSTGLVVPAGKNDKKRKRTSGDMVFMKRSAFCYVWLGFLSMLLAACGGGQDASLELPGASSYSLVLAASPSSTTSDASPVTLTATLLAPNGAAVPGATLQFSSTAGRLAVTSAQTDGAGKASVVLSAGYDGIKSGIATVKFTDPARDIALASLAVSTQGDEVDDPDSPTPPAIPTMTLTMLSAGGQVVDAANLVTNTEPGKLRAVVLNADGSPATSVIVSFAIDAIAGLSQSTVLTNSSGVAEVVVTATAAGAGRANATADVGELSISDSVVFATALVSDSDPGSQLVLDLGSLQNGVFSEELGSDATGPIAPGSVVTITADVVDTATGLPFTGSVNVTFRSVCTDADRATIDEQVSTVNGRATAAYRPSGCVGSDTVTAEVRTATQTLTARVNLDMAAEGVASISFEEVTTDQLALKGSGGTGRPETADLTFKVIGKQGNALANQGVCFGLSTIAGGISVEPTRASTNGEGLVTTTVVAGTIPTPVRVSAYVDNTSCSATKPSPLVQTVSDELRISTGLPHQRSFSLAVSAAPTSGDKFPPYNYDGIEYTATVFAADRFHNPVPVGTAFNFWTELGAIEPSCTADESGTCSVTWRSQSPRVSVGSGGRPGRSQILAYAVGEESFVDANGNGKFDAGETIYQQLGEIIKDINRNSVFDAGDEFVDFNGDGVYTSANTRFDGVLCGTGSNCSGDASVHVRAFNEIVMSANSARIYVVHPNANLGSISFDSNYVLTGISNPSTLVDNDYEYTGSAVSKIYVGNTTDGARAGAIRVLATDTNGNQLAPGTIVKVGIVPSGGAQIDNQGGNKDSYTLTRVSGTNDWFDGLFFIKPPEKAAVDGYLRVTVTHTDGVEQVFNLAVVDSATPTPP